MPDYENMSATDAVRLAKDVSGLTSEEIARRTGVGVNAIRQYIRQDDAYTPSLERIPALCDALGNTVLLQWLEEQIRPRQRDIPEATTRAQVLTACARVTATLGDVHRVLAESEGGGITPDRAREIRGLLHDVTQESRMAMEALKPMASAGRLDCEPLMSVASDKVEIVEAKRSRFGWLRKWGT
ncbi:MAG: helix-turn-helix transcriptional regulator [Pseudomonadota bacterium]